MLEQLQFELHRASSHFLLMKTLFLVALATGNKVSELAAITRIAVLFTPDKGKVTIPIRPGFLYKNQFLAHSPPNIIIRALATKQRQLSPPPLPCQRSPLLAQPLPRVGIGRSFPRLKISPPTQQWPNLKLLSPYH